MSSSSTSATTAGTTDRSDARHDPREAILSVRDLRKHFPRKTRGIIRRADDPVKAVDGISFDLYPGETLGVVGESGCGKSTAGRTTLQLLPPTSGTITFKGQDITGIKGERLRKMRTEMQMVFQDPVGSLNPRQTVGSIIGAPFDIQGITPEGGVKAEVQSLMERVGLNPEHYNRYPHEFSGGPTRRLKAALRRGLVFRHGRCPHYGRASIPRRAGRPAGKLPGRRRRLHGHVPRRT